jgi:hypothetical protein
MNQNQADSGIPYDSIGKENALATLGVLFIGQSVQRLTTNGGQPIYLTTSAYAPIFNVTSRSKVGGVPTLSGSSWFAPWSVIWRCTEWDSGGMCAPSA